MDEFIRVLLHGTLPGAAGGGCWFLLGLKNNRYKNKYVLKFFMELVGGSCVSSFVGPVVSGIFAGSGSAMFVSFAVGAAWSDVLQRTRIAITALVQKQINNDPDGEP